MKTLITLFAATLFAGCATGPSVAEQAVEAVQIANARHAQLASERREFLRSTPHEYCLAKDVRKRHGSMKECKVALERQQAETREAMAQADREIAEIRQMGMQIIMNRPSFQPIYMAPPPRMQMYVPPPVQQPINCTTTRNGTVSSTTCR